MAVLWFRLGEVVALAVLAVVLVLVGAHRTVGGALVLVAAAVLVVTTGWSAWSVRRGREREPSRRWWLCELPLVDHAYAVVGADELRPLHWRCRRCGVRRWTRPSSAGESVTAAKAETLWVKRYDE